MKDRLKRLVDKLKTFVEAWKIWIFFIALIGTNGGQQMYYHEPNLQKKADSRKYDHELIEKLVKLEVAKLKPTIIKQTIYKADEAAVKKLIETELNKHYDSSRH